MPNIARFGRLFEEPATIERFYPPLTPPRRGIPFRTEDQIPLLGGVRGG